MPRIKWEEHRVVVNGLVDKEIVFTMEDIVKLPAITIPVTLVCAGNRRKEENMVKKTIGFSWGPAGVSTSDWTGVRLADVLKASKDGERKGRGDWPCLAPCHQTLPFCLLSW